MQRIKQRLDLYLQHKATINSMWFFTIIPFVPTCD